MGRYRHRRINEWDRNAWIRGSIPHVVQIAKDERLVQREPHSDNVPCILHGVFVALFQRQVLEQELLVVRELDDQRYIKDLLEPAVWRLQVSL